MNVDVITNIQKLLKHVDSTVLRLSQGFVVVDIYFFCFVYTFSISPLMLNCYSIVFTLETGDQISLYMMLHKRSNKRQRFLQINATSSVFVHGRMRKMEFGN